MREHHQATKGKTEEETKEKHRINEKTRFKWQQIHNYQ